MGLNLFFFGFGWLFHAGRVGSMHHGAAPGSTALPHAMAVTTDETYLTSATHWVQFRVKTVNPSRTPFPEKLGCQARILSLPPITIEFEMALLPPST